MHININACIIYDAMLNAIQNLTPHPLPAYLSTRTNSKEPTVDSASDSSESSIRLSAVFDQ